VRLVEGGLGKPLALRAAGADIDVVARLAEREVGGRPTFWTTCGTAKPCSSEAESRSACCFRGPGNLAGMVGRSVAVVGSRASTGYGRSVATDLAADLGARGVSAISAGGCGIDAAADGGAVAGAGRRCACCEGCGRGVSARKAAPTGV
jgi:DNA processing protein